MNSNILMDASNIDENVHQNIKFQWKLFSHISIFAIFHLNFEHQQNSSSKYHKHFNPKIPVALLIWIFSIRILRLIEIFPLQKWKFQWHFSSISKFHHNIFTDISILILSPMMANLTDIFPQSHIEIPIKFCIRFQFQQNIFRQHFEFWHFPAEFWISLKYFLSTFLNTSVVGKLHIPVKPAICQCKFSTKQKSLLQSQISLRSGSRTKILPQKCGRCGISIPFH